MKTIKMKDSGIEWIGEIPENIQLKRIKFLVDYTKGQKPDVVNTDCIGMPYIGASEMAGAVPTNYTSDKIPICTPKDILVLWDGAKAGLIATNMNGAVASTVVKLTVKDEGVFPKYLFYLLKYGETYFKDKVNGTTIPHMSYDYIDDIPFISFEISVQQKIADFLDEKCADIDKLIANQQGQIEKLKEYKQAIITQAVTKGLNPSAPMKDSGVEWIGEIPEGWNKSRVGLLYKIVLGKMLCPNKISDDYTLEKYYCATNVHFDSISSSDALKEMWFSKLEKELYKVNNGDLLIVEGGAGAGGCFIVSGITENIFIQNSVMIVRSRNISNTRYLKYWIENLVKRGYVDVICNKATIPHFTKDKLSNAPCAVPPIEEQQQIANYLDNKCEQVDKLISIKQAKIEKLNEYKKSLIYEYVTGKKEVV